MDKAIFHGDIAQMMNTDSHWHGSGSRAFTTDEMNIFIEHLRIYVNENMWQINERALTFALLETARIDSAQDRAKAIKTKLEL